MMNIKEIRRERLLEFLADFDGKDKDAAAALGIEPGFLSQLKMGKTLNAKSGRNIGEELARSMESAADLPVYWFDYITDSDALRAQGRAILNDLDDDELQIVVDFADRVRSLPRK